MIKGGVKHKNFGLKRKTNSRQAQEFSSDELRETLIHDAEAIGVPHGTAEIVAEKITKAVERWLEKHDTVTIGDLERQITKEAKKYNADLAYVYQNRGKII